MVITGKTGFVVGLVSRLISGIANAVVAAATSRITLTLAGMLGRAFLALATGLSVVVLGAVFGATIAWIVGELARYIGLTNTNPVTDALAFFFNFIFTQPGKVFTAIKAGVQYIAQTIAFELQNAIVSELNKVITVFARFGAFSSLIRTVTRAIGGTVTLPISRPIQPRVDSSGNVYYGQPRRDTSPDYGPQPLPLTPQQRQQTVPGTIIIEGTEIRALFTDWAYGEGLGQ